MIEMVIIVVIAIAVWLFIHFRKKKHESESGSSVKPVSTQKAPPEPKVESKIEPASVGASEVVDVIPEDSTLRRHYLQNLGALDDSPSVVVEPKLSEEPVVVENSEVSADVVETSPVSRVPEDVVLKRHFMQQLVAETEAEMPPRPTDSTLKRHYDAQVMSLVISQLQALK